MKVLTLNAYQKQASEFARYSSGDYPFLALGEEAGEVLGKLAKAVRKSDTPSALLICHMGLLDAHKELRDSLQKELGDVLWQLQACASELNLTLEEIAQMNLDKLSGRAERGTIVGEGDKR